MTTRGRRHKQKGGDEVDCFEARRWYNWPSGVAKAIKRSYNKRVRRIVKDEIEKLKTDM